MVATDVVTSAMFVAAILGATDVNNARDYYHMDKNMSVTIMIYPLVAIVPFCSSVCIAIFSQVLLFMSNTLTISQSFMSLLALLPCQI
jgi:hypothetical protein